MKNVILEFFILQIAVCLKHGALALGEEAHLYIIWHNDTGATKSWITHVTHYTHVHYTLYIVQ